MHYRIIITRTKIYLICWEQALTSYHYFFCKVISYLYVFLSTGVLLTFVCNDRMSDTVDGMVDTSTGILNEAIFFINRTVNVS